MKFSRSLSKLFKGGIIFVAIFGVLAAPFASLEAKSWNLSGHAIIDTFQANVSGRTLQNGYTATLQNREAMFAIHPGISPEPFDIRIDSIDLLPGGVEHVRPNELHVGPILEVSHDADISKLKQDFTIRIKVNRGGRYFRIWLRRWNPKAQTWDRIRNQLDDLHQWAVANVKEPGIYAAFESQEVEEGYASWFRDSRTDIAAHNGYAIGSKIRVTNLDNARSVIVTVVSRGPYVQGRVVDLSYDAFAKLAPPGSGIARVGIWPVDNAKHSGSVLGETVTREESTPAPAPKTTTVAARPLVGNKNVDTSIRARAYAAMNADTGEIVSAKNADQKFPLASLTKLMTALVVLDENPDWRKLVTYEPDDNADGAKLYIQYGDKVNVHDLWYTMLVGSANNAAKMLRKSTGLSVVEFRDKMNAKAKSLGLSTLYFYEPTGLDHKNVGSASDYVRLAEIAFNDAKLRDAVTLSSYYFRTAGRNEPHTITSQNKLLGSGWDVTGTKTGYTDEAMWCLVGQVKGESTKKNIIAVTLGSPSDSYRYQDMDKALNAGFAPYVN